MTRDEQKAAQKALKDAVDKEIKRIKRFTKSAEKRGYIFSNNVIPPKPQKITEATLRKYQKITPETLYKKAAYYDKGRKIKGSTRRKQERKEAAKKAAKTRKINLALKVLKEVQRIIDTWSPSPHWSPTWADIKERDRDQLQSILDGAISQEGRENVALRLQENAERVYELVYEILYGSGDTPGGGHVGVQLAMATFVTILYGRPLTVEESIEASEYGEQNEYEDDLP